MPKKLVLSYLALSLSFMSIAYPIQCGVVLRGIEGVKEKIDSTLELFRAELKKTDQNNGEGLRYAKIFTPDSPNPILGTELELTPELIKNSNQTVFFYSERKIGGKDGWRSRGATGVKGIPTHVFIDPKTGKIAYMGFQGQPVSLVEHMFYRDANTTREIPNQGIARHAGGFSTPVGNLKGSQSPLSDYTIAELRKIVGREGEFKRIEFESGVVVEGVIDSYTKNNYHAGDIATVISFKEGTTTVTYGVHTLFEKEWGIYDLLIAPEMISSNSKSTP